MKQRGAVLIIAMVLCGAMLVMPALAATTAKTVQANASLAADGSYTMQLQVKISLDQVVDDICFPIVSDAEDVTLFGSRPGTHRANGALQVEIPAKFLSADIPIYYTAQGALTRGEREGFLEMEIPLLCGFAYPVEAMTFSVTLPASLEGVSDPVKFTSTTHGREIESSLTFSIQGQTITGELSRPLNDNASLILHLTVPQEMFPQAKLRQWSINFDDIAMYALTAVAVAYWLLFLRCLPPRRVRSTTGPEGLSAGELGTALIGRGGDLTMMVLSWAQLGYLLIHPDKHGRVMLYKRMDMGNERSAYEQCCFRLLFGKQRQLSGTGVHYARVFRKVASLKPENRGYYRRRSGSRRIFRFILALVGGLAGVSLGQALSTNGIVQVLLAIALAVPGFVSSIAMQDFILGLHLRSRFRLVLGLGLALFWLALGWMAGEPVVSAWMVTTQLLGGVAAGYGGMRTESGRMAMSRTLGLRRYLKTVPMAELQRIVRERPDYFFAMAPAAAALGVDEAFARRFGSKRLPGCPWLTTGMDGHMTAKEWDRLLRRTIAALDKRAMRLPLDRLLGRH